MLAVLAIFRKDLKVIFRDRSALIFIFGLPLIFTLVFGTIFGGRSDSKNTSAVRVLVSNRDTGPHGAEFLKAMQLVGLSVNEEKDGADALKEKVKKGEQPIGVVVPETFSAELEKAVKSGIAGQQGDQAKLRVFVDPAQSEVAGMAQGAIFAASQRVTGPLYAKAFGREEMRPAITLDVATTDTLENATTRPKPSAGDIMIPGFAVYFVFFMANGVATTLLVERQEGTLRRMLSAPVTPGQVLCGKLLARSFLGLIQTLILFVIGVFWMKLHIEGAVLGVAVTALLTIFAATGLGLLIASLGKTQEQIQGMTTLALLLMGLLSGCLYPRALMPETMQKLSLITPHAWALNAYQDLLLRQLPITATLGNLAIVLAFGVGFYVLALARFRYE